MLINGTNFETMTMKHKTKLGNTMNNMKDKIATCELLTGDLVSLPEILLGQLMVEGAGVHEGVLATSG